MDQVFIDKETNDLICRIGRSSWTNLSVVISVSIVPCVSAFPRMVVAMDFVDLIYHNRLAKSATLWDLFITLLKNNKFTKLIRLTEYQ